MKANFVNCWMTLFLIILFPTTLRAEEEGAESKSKEINSDTKSNSSGGTQKGAAEAEKTLKIGNLAFPPSQEPSPLISFGQNVINRKELQVQTLFSQLKGEDQYSINVNPAMIYAFTDSLSLFIVAPFSVRNRNENHRSSGGNDLVLQVEYAFYTKAYQTYYDQATIVANITIPTGSTKKEPPTGIGANSYFLGATYARMEIDWFWFVSSGKMFTGSSHRIKFGEQFLYQFGFGRRIANNEEWLFDWMIEVDGIYAEKDEIQKVNNRNSGGNTIYLTPSLWISTKESFFLQFGIGAPLVQKLCGRQKKNRYLLVITSGWLF